MLNQGVGSDDSSDHTLGYEGQRLFVGTERQELLANQCQDK